MTISILKAERFYPLGKPIQRPAKEGDKPADVQVRPGVFRKADGTFETRGYNPPAEPPKPVESSLPATPNALGDWIEWHGGECPISSATGGTWQYRVDDENTVYTGNDDARGRHYGAAWAHTSSRVITSYRLLPNGGAA